MKVICAWCGRDIKIAADGSPLKDTYAIERGDGDKFYFCGAGHAIWWLSDETDDKSEFLGGEDAGGQSAQRCYETHHSGAPLAPIAEKLAEGVIDLRVAVGDWYVARSYDTSIQTLMLGLMEEVGELAQAVLLTQCGDFQPSVHKRRGELGDLERHKDLALEVGDVLTYLMAICNWLYIDPKMKSLGGQLVTVTVRTREESDG